MPTLPPSAPPAPATAALSATHASDPQPRAAQPQQAQDLELSALVYLLARVAQAPDDPDCRLLAVRYLERVAAQGDTQPLMRRTTQHLAQLWRGGLGPGQGAAAAARAH